MSMPWDSDYQLDYVCLIITIIFPIRNYETFFFFAVTRSTKFSVVNHIKSMNKIFLSVSKFVLFEIVHILLHSLWYTNLINANMHDSCPIYQVRSNLPDQCIQLSISLNCQSTWACMFGVTFIFFHTYLQ